MKTKQSDLTFNGAFNERVGTKYVVFHHAQALNCTIQDVHNWHLHNGWIGVGYHFVIRKDGTVYEGRPIWAEGAHTFGYNDVSIGVCFEGDFRHETIRQEQINAGIELLRHIRSIYLAVQGIRHKDLNNTDCPANGFRDEVIIEGMKDEEKPKIDDELKDNLLFLESYGQINNPQYWLDRVNSDGDIIVNGKYLKEVFRRYAELYKSWI